MNYVELEIGARLFPREEVIEASIKFGGENRAWDISRPETWGNNRQTFVSAPAKLCSPSRFLND